MTSLGVYVNTYQSFCLVQTLSKYWKKERENGGGRKRGRHSSAQGQQGLPEHGQERCVHVVLMGLTIKIFK